MKYTVICSSETAFMWTLFDIAKTW